MTSRKLGPGLMEFYSFRACSSVFSLADARRGWESKNRKGIFLSSHGGSDRLELWKASSGWCSLGLLPLHLFRSWIFTEVQCWISNTLIFPPLNFKILCVTWEKRVWQKGRRECPGWNNILLFLIPNGWLVILILVKRPPGKVCECFYRRLWHRK